MKCNNCNAEWTVSAVQAASITICPFCQKPLAKATTKEPHTFVEALKAIIGHGGMNALLDGKHAVALFSDMAPKLRRERMMFSYFVQCDGAPRLINALGKSASEQLSSIKITVSQMQNDFLVSEDVAIAACEAFWEAIGGKSIQIHSEPMTIQHNPPKTVVHGNVHPDAVSSTPAVQSVPNGANPKLPQHDVTGYETAAKAGNAEAQFNLGMCYFNGTNGLTQSYSAAAVWIEKAAKQNHGFALLQLALMYEDGKGVPLSRNKTEQLLKEASTNSDPTVRIRASLMLAPYEKARTDTTSPSASVFAPNTNTNPKDFTIEKKKKTADDLYKEALKFDKGYGAPKNPSLAFQLYNEAAKQGSVDAKFALGQLFATPDKGYFDESLSFEWYKAAAEAGHARAMYELSLCYRDAKGTKVDSSKFLYWLRLAASKGDNKASFMLKTNSGGSSPTPPLQSGHIASNYESGAANGNAEAQYNLAMCYYHGTGGVSKSYSSAAAWLEKAALKNHAGAQLRLAEMYEKGQGVMLSFSKAEQLYQKAAQSNNQLIASHARDALRHFQKEQSKSNGSSWLSKLFGK